MELNTQEELKAHLMTASEEFRNLVERHHELDLRVEELEAMSHPSEEEQLEEARLKKVKLHLKDQIIDYLNRHATASVS